MNLSDTTPVPPVPDPTHRATEPRSRRRRRGQLNVPPDAEGRAALLASLSHRAYPTYELFVFAAVCGAILGLGYLLDSQALLLFGALLAPLLLPWVGLLLATITASTRFFFDTLMALLFSAVLVFLVGLLAGFAARAFLPRTFSEAFVHSRLWWPDLLILALGAVILTLSFVRSESKPFLPSVVLAYEFFLPLSAGAFGLGSGVGDIWPHGLLVFFVHFAWAGIFGLFTLVALRIAPTSASAFVFSAAVAFVLLAILVVLMSGGNWAAPFTSQLTRTLQPTGAAGNLPVPGPSTSPTVSVATTLNETPTPLFAVAATGASPTLEAGTLSPEAPTATLAFEPTPLYAQVRADKGGAVLREAPGGKGLTTLDNFTYVEILPETQQVSGYTWVHVIALQNGERREGWIVQLYLETATPAPVLEPLATPTSTTAP